jgi:lysozyme family protein
MYLLRILMSNKQRFNSVEDLINSVSLTAPMSPSSRMALEEAGLLPSSGGGGLSSLETGYSPQTLRGMNDLISAQTLQQASLRPPQPRPSVVRRQPTQQEKNETLRRELTTLMMPNAFKGSVPNLINGILSREGGYVNNPNDRGGATNYGITHRTLARHLGVPSVTPEQVRNLPVEKAREIYKEEYITAPGFDKLSMAPNLQALVVDTGVHTGPQDAVRYMQRALKSLGVQDIKVDGQLGPITLKALNDAISRLGEARVNNAVLNIRKNELIQQAQKPGQGQFRRGWLNRVQKFEMETQPRSSTTTTTQRNQ